MDANYSLSQFVADLRSITVATADETDVLRQVAPLAERLAASSDLNSKPAIHSNIEKGFRFNLLHEEADHSLAIALRQRRAARRIVVGLEGAEKNIFWRRLDNGSVPGFAELERVGEMDCALGRAVVLPSTTIHSVENTAIKPSVSLHVYGKNVYYTGRSQFDIVNKRELPWGKSAS